MVLVTNRVTSPGVMQQPSTSAVAGDVLPLLFAEPGVQPNRHVVVPAPLLGGSFGRLLCTYDARPERIGATGPLRALRLWRGRVACRFEGCPLVSPVS
jgi:hypothetical protein